jgi:hypothetical protein
MLNSAATPKKTSAPNQARNGHPIDVPARGPAAIASLIAAACSSA